MLKRYLMHQLCGPEGITTVGVVVDVGSGPCLVFAKLSAMLTDGDGWRTALDWKGHASLKPCFRHWNVFRKAWGRLRRECHSDFANTFSQ